MLSNLFIIIFIFSFLPLIIWKKHVSFKVYIFEVCLGVCWVCCLPIMVDFFPKLLTVHSSIVVADCGEVSWEPSYEKSWDRFQFSFCQRYQVVNGPETSPSVDVWAVVLTLHTKYELRPHVNIQLRLWFSFHLVDFKILLKILSLQHCVLVLGAEVF